MSALFGLMFGIGALLIYMSFWELPAREKKERKVPAIQQLLRQADLEKFTVSMFYMVSAVAAFVAMLLTFALTSLVPLAVLAAGVGFFGPRLVVKHRATQRQAQLRDLWPDAVDHLRSAIRAGLSLPDALMQLQYRGPEPLRPAFSSFASDYRASGEFLPALNRLKDRLSDPTADNIIEALKVTREVG